jgi:hypothetical protein
VKDVSDDCETLGLVLHGVISSYQAAIRDALGDSDAALINLAEYLVDYVRLEGVDADSLGFEGLIGVMAERVAGLGLARLSLEESEPGYVFRVEGCVWAGRLHGRKTDRDATCPWGLIALATYQASTGNRVHLSDSTYTATGSKTRVMPLKGVTDLLTD